MELSESGEGLVALHLDPCYSGKLLIVTRDKRQIVGQGGGCNPKIVSAYEETSCS